VFTAPLWLYQIWAFITPGLRKNERKYTIIFVISSTLLFAAGMSLAYAVLSKGLSILLTQAGNGVQALLTVNDYLSFVTLMLVIFGAAFELPLIVVNERSQVLLVHGFEFLDHAASVVSLFPCFFQDLVILDLLVDKRDDSLQLADAGLDSALVVDEHLPALAGCRRTFLDKVGVASHLHKWHSGGAHAAQECHPADGGRRVPSMPARRVAVDRHDQPDAFVVAQVVLGKAGLLRDFADGQLVFHTVTSPLVYKLIATLSQ